MPSIIKESTSGADPGSYGHTTARENSLHQINDLLGVFEKLEVESGSTINLLWMSDAAFITMSRIWKVPGIEGTKWFHLTIKYADHRRFIFSIYGKTLEEAISCLGFCCALDASGAVAISIVHFWFNTAGISNYGADALLTNPLSTIFLKELLSTHTQMYVEFQEMTFTTSQARVLARSGVKIGLKLCSFADDGAIYAASCPGKTKNPHAIQRRSLRIQDTFPFDDESFLSYLSRTDIDTLELSSIDALSERCCQALSSTDMYMLRLSMVDMEDGGLSLIESVKKGCGPCCYDLVSADPDFDLPLPFASHETYQLFLKALGHNTHVVSLSLGGISCQQGIPQALVLSLEHNNHLQHLRLSDCRITLDCWNELTNAIQYHPTLSSLCFNSMTTDPRPFSFQHGAIHEREERTLLFARMAENCARRLTIEHDHGSFDELLWEKCVVPHLDCRVYEPLFEGIKSTSSPSMRRALFAMAVDKTSSSPWLTWTLLKNNQDLLIQEPAPNTPKNASDIIDHKLKHNDVQGTGMHSS